ncbi:MAG: ATP-binding protein [Proteobacteria bacterium]|nr:ATP-binding protein [Pseudomonadota bacterium]
MEKKVTSDDLHALFRCAHNLKGSSRSVGLGPFADFVHKVEDLITKVKNAPSEYNEATANIFLEAQRVLAEWTQGLRDSSDFTMATASTLAKIYSLLTNDQTASSGHQEVSNSGIEGFTLFDDPSPTITQKDIGTILVESGATTQAEIEKAVRAQNRKIGEILIESGAVSAQAVDQALDRQRTSGQPIDETLRVSTKKLDAIMRLVGELCIQTSIVKNAKNTESLSAKITLDAIELTQKIVAELQVEAMSLRMQPIAGLFQRMERVCRDVAKELGKDIKVILRGTEVELDKTVTEQIKDPLVHILRNAVDHGIENKAERAKTDKSPQSTVILEGSQTSTHVVISIRDDGAGLNEQKIIKNAKAKGLIDQDAVLSTGEIHNLLFLPGFSTADKVTDVSGRGVGMDVVKKAVDQLHGNIQIISKQGEGTEFRIEIPTSLSLLDAVIVGVNLEKYAVPLQDIAELININDTPLQNAAGGGQFFSLRGEVIPYSPLAHLIGANYGVGSERPDGASTCTLAIVRRSEGRSCAIGLDKLFGQQTVIVRKASEKITAIDGVAGTTILSDGSATVIVDIPTIARNFVNGMNTVNSEVKSA